MTEKTRINCIKKKYNINKKTFDYYLTKNDINNNIKIKENIAVEKLNLKNITSINFVKKYNKKPIIFNSTPIKISDKNTINISDKNEIPIKNNLIQIDESFLDLIDDFCKIHNLNQNDVLSNSKIKYRYFCYRYLNYIRSINLPIIELNKYYEAVLIEYRCFIHLEFIIRNAIIKLGSNWSFTIICGNLNYDFIINLCLNISENIKIIKTEYDNLDQSSYSKLLASIDFWHLFKGEKILIYQEDSCIFKSNINDFINWDYIGAPWPKNQTDNSIGVGNGGFSLRTKKCMIDVINKISIKDTIFNSSTLEYINNTGMSVGPEDVYFSLNMITYNIGKVADRHSASKFSIESVYNSDSLGGHNFWLCNKNWEKKLYENIVIQFKPNYNIKMLEHRGGWKSVINSLININFFNKNSNINFFDIIEMFFLWDLNYICNNKWAGIIHCTQNTPSYLNIVNIKFLFKNENFIKSLDNCLWIVSLSEYVTNFLREEFNKINKNIKIYTLKHPVDDTNIIMFNYDYYLENNNKNIIQIGQQLRKVSSIYLLKIQDKFGKIWLTGTKNIIRCNLLLDQEITYLNLDINKINKNSVNIKYTDTFEEYDILLSKNIVFVDLFDASANNTVLECIIRNTPIIINKLPSVVEYLGVDYPLYFNNLEEARNILNNNNLILKAHEYLKKLDKKELKIDYFIKQLLSLNHTN